MPKKNKVERILKEHYRDMLSLNKDFISAIARPRSINPQIENTGEIRKKKLTKKQVKALARGRKILAAKRLKIAQI